MSEAQANQHFEAKLNSLALRRMHAAAQRDLMGATIATLALVVTLLVAFEEWQKRAAAPDVMAAMGFEATSVLIVLCAGGYVALRPSAEWLFQSGLVLAFYQTTLWLQFKWSLQAAEGEAARRALAGLARTQWPAGSALFAVWLVGDQIMLRGIRAADRTVASVRREWAALKEAQRARGGGGDDR